MIQEGCKPEFYKDRILLILTFLERETRHQCSGERDFFVCCIRTWSVSVYLSGSLEDFFNMFVFVPSIFNKSLTLAFLKIFCLSFLSFFHSFLQVTSSFLIVAGLVCYNSYLLFLPIRSLAMELEMRKTCRRFFGVESYYLLMLLYLHIP